MSIRVAGAGMSKWGMIARTPAARSFVEVIFILGAAVVIPEAQLSGERLVKAISDLLGDSSRLQEMAERARALAHPAAAAEIAEMTAALAGSKSKAIPA